MENNITGRALRGEKFNDLHIIDMHCHLREVQEFYFPGGYIEEMIADANLPGIESLCIAPHISLSYDHRDGNRQSVDAVNKFPDRVFAMVMVNPNQPEDITSEIEKYYKIPQFIGVKLHPGSHSYPLSGDKYGAVFECVTRLGGFILTHTWETDGNCNAAECEKVLQRHPGVPLIMAHTLGVPKGIPKALRLANEYENCYIDTSGFEFSNASIEHIMKNVDNSKVFYGSDMPYHDVRSGLSRILLSNLTDEVKIKILSKNYRDMLKKYPKRG